jgi:hypothetical protein
VRRVAAVVLLVLATLLWTVGIVAVWANRQLLDTQNWVQTSDRLLENEEIRTALSTVILERLFAGQPVENQIREALPPRLAPLAGPAAAGLREVANRNAPRVLGSAAALAAWENANRTAHEALLKVINGDVARGGMVTLDVRDLTEQIAASTGLPANVADRLPENLQQIEVLKTDKIEAAQKAVHTAKTLTIVLVVLAVLLLAGAVALSTDRRRGVIAAGGCIIFAGVLVLALRRLGGDAAVNALAEAPNARPAVRAVFTIGTSLLTDAAWGSIVFGLFVVTGAWLIGSGRRATVLRRVSAPALREHPAAFRIGLGLLILLLVIWGPVPWTHKFWPVLVFAIAAFVWLERVRHRTLEEFGDVPAGELGRSVRDRWARRPGRGAQPGPG